MGGERNFSCHHFLLHERVRAAARHLPVCTISTLGLMILPWGRVALEKWLILGPSPECFKFRAHAGSQNGAGSQIHLEQSVPGLCGLPNMPFVTRLGEKALPLYQLLFLVFR